MSELIIDDVTIRYGDTAALDRFSLAVSSGEIMAVVGPSGSGKSTLLRAVAGLEPLQTGGISLAGRDLSGVPTHKRGLGLMFQDHGLFSHMSVADNIGYGLRTAAVAVQVQQQRVAELLALVDLDGFEGRGTGELSGGEAQRVALARALAPEPGLLMLDEPLGSLDRALRDQLTGDLRRLLTTLGQTAVHVTHDQAEAFALADRVAVVSAGCPVAVGTPAELWADPGSRFVAEFLGHRNIWLVGVDESGAVSLGDQRLGRLPADHPLWALGSGSHLVVVPSAALRVDDVPTGVRAGDGSLRDTVSDTITVAVTETVFRRGVHDVTAVIGGNHAATTVDFTTTGPVTVGDAIPLRADLTDVRPLTSE